MQEQEEDGQKIIDSWVRALRERRDIVLTSEEHAQFEEEAFAEERDKETPFILGEPLRRRPWSLNT